MKKQILIALADDHVLLRNALASMINTFDGCKVILQANNGADLLQRMSTGLIPDLLILDLSMPELDGYETASELQKKFPQVSVLMLTMYNTEQALIRLLQLGVRGFLKKDIHPSELKAAIESVMEMGYYYSHDATGKLINLVRKGPDSSSLNKTFLNDTEVLFLKLACTEYTYKEIAMAMKLNPRSVDNLRDNLFTKLDIKSRVGLVMYAIRHGIVTF